ncbi:protein SPEC3-like [Anneissia japonica]|uniref:protein SPEC3-like n=1 Tax=Anneissia japonica TaxID=1529436 RepID=UPI00142563A6|nr:protein SPEC3-like [Anneissia japonica]
MNGNCGKRSPTVQPIMEDIDVREFDEIDESIKYNEAVVHAYAVWRKKTIEHKKLRQKKCFCLGFSLFKKRDIEEEKERQLLMKDMELNVIYASCWDSNSLLSTIPYMPIKLACLCAFLNIFLPGWGTLVGAISIFICSNPQGLTKRESEDLVDPFISNLCVGISQMFTVTFLLVGWIWSVVWGINMVLLSKHHNYLVDSEIKRVKTLGIANKLFK